MTVANRTTRTLSKPDGIYSSGVGQHPVKARHGTPTCRITPYSGILRRSITLLRIADYALMWIAEPWGVSRYRSGEPYYKTSGPRQRESVLPAALCRVVPVFSVTLRKYADQELGYILSGWVNTRGIPAYFSRGILTLSARCNSSSLRDHLT